MDSYGKAEYRQHNFRSRKSNVNLLFGSCGGVIVVMFFLAHSFSLLLPSYIYFSILHSPLKVCLIYLCLRTLKTLQFKEVWIIKIRSMWDRSSIMELTWTSVTSVNCSFVPFLMQNLEGISSIFKMRSDTTFARVPKSVQWNQYRHDVILDKCQPFSLKYILCRRKYACLWT